VENDILRKERTAFLRRNKAAHGMGRPGPRGSYTREKRISSCALRETASLTGRSSKEAGRKGGIYYLRGGEWLTALKAGRTWTDQVPQEGFLEGGCTLPGGRVRRGNMCVLVSREPNAYKGKRS